MFRQLAGVSSDVGSGSGSSQPGRLQTPHHHIRSNLLDKVLIENYQVNVVYNLMLPSYYNSYVYNIISY